VLMPILKKIPHVIISHFARVNGLKDQKSLTITLKKKLEINFTL